ncbi:MAG: RluA family pseudouridine synthase [Neomegalonema sp.]|nr:RluA family pseudouridine synthase [Neomegalonema sp.]
MANEDPFDAASDEDGFSHSPTLDAIITDAAAGQRLDKALALCLEADLAAEHGLSRTRLRALIEEGQVSLNGGAVRDPSRKVAAGDLFQILPPPPKPLELIPEAIPLDIIYEDTDLLVVDKPSGMAAHPAPGAETGTLVHALLAHCGDSLSGVGGVERPGVVHRIDKDTSGLLVVAKNDRAHAGLSQQFAKHSVERSYSALVWGAPDRGDPRLMGLPAVTSVEDRLRIEAELARARHDRKKMAVVTSGGKRAVTWIAVRARYGVDPSRPFASLVECMLETGRTHQIRVHMAHIGHPLLGDQTYGRGRKLGSEAGEAAQAAAAFHRQALHAGLLGFTHPCTGEALRFESAAPPDFAELRAKFEPFRCG